MKHVVKGPEPEAFTDWKALENDDWQPTFEDLRGGEKTAVKEALMTEQGFICCYCERRLTDRDSHVEHFRPQSDPDVDPLDFSNMLCSCQNELKKGEPRHCGNLKENWFDPMLLIAPFDPECGNRFAFSGRGRIKPARETDAAAAETIRRLGLGIPKRNSLREKAIEPFLDESLTSEELRQFVTDYLQRGSDGRFGEFWTTIRYVFRGYDRL